MFESGHSAFDLIHLEEDEVPSLLINFLVFFGIGSSGLVAGWWLRGRAALFTQTKTVDGHSDQDDQADHDSEQRRQTATAIQKLQELAHDMAADVEQHSERVTEASEVLQSVDRSEIEDVTATVAKILHANEKLQAKLDSAEDKLNEQAVQIASKTKEAHTDALTAIANRRAFDMEMAQAESCKKSQGTPASVMMLDVDFFKKFNDTHGHQAGDAVLKSVAKVLRKTIHRNGIVARYGGEEFAVIFHGRKATDCMEIAEKARKAIGKTVVEFEGKQLRVTASGGLANLATNEKSETLVKRADSLLYQAKESGRNCGFWSDGFKSARMTLNTKTEVKKLETKKPDVKKSVPVKKQVEKKSVQETKPGKSSKKTATWVAEIAGRQEFCEDLSRRVAEWKRGGVPVSTLLLHIDDLETITREQSENATSLVLRTTSQFLEASMREMDHVARFDDDTFALMLPNTSFEDAASVGDRLRFAISRCEVPIPDGSLAFTISVGVAVLSNGDNSGSLLSRAKTSLEQAIQQGGNACFGVANRTDQPTSVSETDTANI